MPIYEYKCEKGHVFEEIQRMIDDPHSSCTKFGALMVAPSGALASGGGFWVLNGTANFSTPLKNPSGPADIQTPPKFAYSFFGTLSPGGGTDGAGLTATVTAGLPAADSKNPFP